MRVSVPLAPNSGVPTSQLRRDLMFSYELNTAGHSRTARIEGSSGESVGEIEGQRTLGSAVGPKHVLRMSAACGALDMLVALPPDPRDLSLWGQSGMA
jgi:hypothetical protein